METTYRVERKNLRKRWTEVAGNLATLEEAQTIFRQLEANLAGPYRVVKVTVTVMGSAIEGMREKITKLAEEYSFSFDQVEAAVNDALAQPSWVLAIKAVRASLGTSLEDSKAIVDSINAIAKA